MTPIVYHCHTHSIWDQSPMWLQVAFNTAKYKATWVTLFQIMLQFHASPLLSKCGIQDLITVKCNKHHQLDTSRLCPRRRHPPTHTQTHKITVQEILQNLTTHLPSRTSMSQNTVILIFTAIGISSLTSIVILIYYSLDTEFSFLAITSINKNRYVLVFTDSVQRKFECDGMCTWS